MRARFVAPGALLAALALSPEALPHFQLVYTPQLALKTSQDLTLAMVFTHPFEPTHTMNMEKPLAFYVISQRGADAKPQKTDLTQYLQPITWASLQEPGQAYEAKLPRSAVRSLGDYVFILEGAPYYEGSEDKYIQQYTKVVLNVGGIPGNWSADNALPTEIRPLDKPYASWVGGVFRGVVLANGKPVPNAELEVSFVNHRPEIENRRFAIQTTLNAPQDSFQNLGILANERGEFTIGLPRAGWWGICALGSGPQTKFKGKNLSQDAVLWVQATDMK
jgi:cobalt/nickel transport protein